MTPDIQTFFVIKPDGGRYLPEIGETLHESRIAVTHAYAVDDWAKTARSIYRRQLDGSTKSFVAGTESHIWLEQYLFGNKGLLLLLKPEGEGLDLPTEVQLVHEARDGFRSKYYASNGDFTIAVNIDKLDGKPFSGSDIKKATLLVDDGNSQKPLLSNGKAEGVWIRNYFKYLHAPETMDELMYQFQALCSLGILCAENKICDEELQLLMFLRCLTPPSKYKKA